jgi:hypothetical protein
MLVCAGTDNASARIRDTVRVHATQTAHRAAVPGLGEAMNPRHVRISPDLSTGVHVDGGRSTGAPEIASIASPPGEARDQEAGTHTTEASSPRPGQ